MTHAAYHNKVKFCSKLGLLETFSFFRRHHLEHDEFTAIYAMVAQVLLDPFSYISFASAVAVSIRTGQKLRGKE